MSNNKGADGDSIASISIMVLVKDGWLLLIFDDQKIFILFDRLIVIGGATNDFVFFDHILIWVLRCVSANMCTLASRKASVAG